MNWYDAKEITDDAQKKETAENILQLLDGLNFKDARAILKFVNFSLENRAIITGLHEQIGNKSSRRLFGTTTPTAQD